MKKTLKTLLGVFALTLSVGAAVGAGVKAEKEEVQVVEAAGVTFSAGTNIYLEPKGDVDWTGCWLLAWVWYSNSTQSHWETFYMDDLSGYYMFTLDLPAAGFTMVRCSTERTGNEWGSDDGIYNKGDVNFEAEKNWLYAKGWFYGEWRSITYHVAGTFTDPAWQGTSAAYKMSDGFNSKNAHEAYFKLTTTQDNVQLKCTTNYNGSVPGGNWYGDLVPGYNENYIGSQSGNILLKKAGTYELFLNTSRKVWVQIDSNTEATIYANEFLDIIECSDNAVLFSLSDWNNVSGTGSVEYKFSKLTEGARNLLTGAQASEGGSVIQQAAARYDRILSKYGYGEAEGQYHDFMGRTPATLTRVTPIFGAEDSALGNNGTIIIVITSITILATVGAFFLLKKKREN